MQIYGELTAAQPGNPPALALPQPGVTPRVVQGCWAVVLPYKAAQKLLRAPVNSCVYIPALWAHTVQTAQYQQHKPPTIWSAKAGTGLLPTWQPGCRPAAVLEHKPGKHIWETALVFRSTLKHTCTLLVTGSNYTKDLARTANRTNPESPKQQGKCGICTPFLSAK